MSASGSGEFPSLRPRSRAQSSGAPSRSTGGPRDARGEGEGGSVVRQRRGLVNLGTCTRRCTSPGACARGADSSKSAGPSAPRPSPPATDPSRSDRTQAMVRCAPVWCRVRGGKRRGINTGSGEKKDVGDALFASRDPRPVEWTSRGPQRRTVAAASTNGAPEVAWSKQSPRVTRVTT